MNGFFQLQHEKTNSVTVILLIVLSLGIRFDQLLSQSVSKAGAGAVGILVMAHGGRGEWNQAVLEAVKPLQGHCTAEVAFGMAHPDSLQKAVLQLESRGVNKIAVVRLFISGKSFLHATEYFFGRRSDPPKMFAHLHHLAAKETDNNNTNHNVKDVPDMLNLRSSVVINQNGLIDSDITGDIMVQRVLELSTSPGTKSALILAHGAGRDSENTSVLERMNHIARKVSAAGEFREVRVETLREDWPEKRKQAEKRIREFIRQESENGGKVIVVPLRVFGFGPYE
ncbi:MAG: hypothetical protein ACE5IR_23365, partial [bacterium]